MEPLLPVCLTAALLAGFVQGFAGFGSVLVALPLLLTVLDVRTAVPLGSLVAVSINVVMVARLHGHIQRGPMKTLIAGSLPGMAAGAWVLKDAPDALIKGILGAVILLLVAQSVVSPAPRTAPAGRFWAVVAGFCSGTVGVCTGANGPPVIAWASRQPWRRDELRATLTFYFLLTGLCIVTVQSTQGVVTRQVLTLFAWSLPALLAGIKIGGACCGKVDERTFRTVVLTLLGLIGTSMVWQAAGTALR
ncbi:sulfite exporter TauE/SafE family protein [Fundidesulfovibrio terrae]|uniref:sulfite exporter TauE/SafE family protein n=1 Tax=Fundidesulfovibrio terrae TaxID=2922866 RepID=UPI001FAF9F3D|nr:sulfite exporter TauE/SafE family protein [Fundidesulfovibrio terrae]